MATISHDYDATHRLTSVRTLAGAGAYANHTLGYDTRDRIGSVSASVAGQAGTDTYGYDAADRLTSWTRTGTGATAETYDPLADGSLGKLHRGSVVTSFTYDADDRLTAATSAGVTTAYANDTSGRRISRVSPSTSATYTWNASGQLASVTTRASGGATASAAYSYGISGMREAKTVVSSGTTRTTSSVWSGMQLASERDSDGTRLRFLYGPGGIPLELSVTTAGGTTTSYAYQLDSAGSVVALTNAAGVAVATYAYDPWGNPTSIGGTDAWLAARQPLRYRGYCLDTETGLYYLPARYYDPAVMRFLSADPAGPSAGSPASLNAYAYCEGDPVGKSDPTGAIADTDGNGKLDSWDSAMHMSSVAKNAHAKAYYRAKARARYYAAEARRVAGNRTIESAGANVLAAYGRLSRIAADASGQASTALRAWRADLSEADIQMRRNDLRLTRPTSADWAFMGVGTFFDGVTVVGMLFPPVSIGGYLCGAIVDGFGGGVYVHSEHAAERKTNADIYAWAVTTVVPGASTASLLCNGGASLGLWQDFPLIGYVQ